MKLINLIIIICSLLATANQANANKAVITKDSKICLKDLEFVKSSIIIHSAAYKNEEDKNFHQWFNSGYLNAATLANTVKDQDDCIFVIKFFLAGFEDNRIAIKPKISLPPEQYPGLLTYLDKDKHIVFYKNHNLLYLQKIDIGDELLSINDMSVDNYYKQFLLPFYANNRSIMENGFASLYTLLTDANSFIPIPRKASFSTSSGVKTIDLKFTNVDTEVQNIINKKIKPLTTRKFRIEMFSDGAWIRLPSFYPDNQEEILLRGIITSLKKLAQNEYIIFDLRGNLGGKQKWSNAIIRNLFGDNFLKSLGAKHPFNHNTEYYFRTSAKNFAEFKISRSQNEIKKYSQNLASGQDFYKQDYRVWQEKDELFTNNDDAPNKAKIILVTDNYCSGSCWLFVNQMKAIPKILHVGLPTNIEHNSSAATRFIAPSQHFEFFLSTAFIKNPAYNFRQAIVPDEIFYGNIHKDLELVPWVLNNFRK